jgi:hypothetical protein
MDYLTDEDILLLKEIYRIPIVDSVIVGGFGGVPFPLSPQFAMGSYTPIAVQFNHAIQKITEAVDAGNTAIVPNIRAYLESFKQFRTDPSNITSDGYEYRTSQQFKAILRGLYTYTGIHLETSKGNNIMPMG